MKETLTVFEVTRSFSKPVILALSVFLISASSAQAGTVWINIMRWSTPPSGPLEVAGVISFSGPNVDPSDSSFYSDDIDSFGIDFGSGLVEFDSVDYVRAGDSVSRYQGVSNTLNGGEFHLEGTESHSAYPLPQSWRLQTYTWPYPGEADPITGGLTNLGTAAYIHFGDGKSNGYVDAWLSVHHGSPVHQYARARG